MPSPALLELTADAQSKLADWSKAHGTPQQVVKRCRLVLLMAAGVPAARAAKTVGTNRHTAELWRDRFRESGPDTLWEIALGRGRKPRAGLAARIVGNRAECCRHGHQAIFKM